MAREVSDGGSMSNLFGLEQLIWFAVQGQKEKRDENKFEHFRKRSNKYVQFKLQIRFLELLNTS